MSDSVRPHRWQPTRLPHPWYSPGKNTGVGCHFLLQCMKVKSESEVTQSCPTLSDPMDCNLPGSSVHAIFQARVLEWGAIAFSDAPRHRANSTQSKSFSLICTKAPNEYERGTLVITLLSLSSKSSHLFLTLACSRRNSANHSSSLLLDGLPLIVTGRTVGGRRRAEGLDLSYSWLPFILNQQPPLISSHLILSFSEPATA